MKKWLIPGLKQGKYKELKQHSLSKSKIMLKKRMETEQDKTSIYWVIPFKEKAELIVSNRNQNNRGF